MMHATRLFLPRTLPTAALAAAVILSAGGCAPGTRPAPGDPTVMRTFGTSGKERRVLAGGREAELFRRDGRGVLTHMWFGGDWPGYERTRLRVYVDGETTASIDMELGLGHGIGFADPAAAWGTARIGKTGHPSGLYNTYRIPFGRGVRVTAQLGEAVPGDPPFWWIIRGVENLPITLGGAVLPENARLRLYKRENYTASPLEEFDLYRSTKAGALYQVTLAARSESFSFLEACMRAYLDGAEQALLLSSGLEDYFLGTYYFNRGKYHTPVAGLTHLDGKDHSFSAYRFHDDDPVLFQKGLRLTCRCGEEVDGKALGDPKATTYTSYVWVYEW
jgi:hypothetical protein